MEAIIVKDSELVKAARGMLGLSQIKFAERLGCVQSTIMCWETDRNDVKPKTFRAILELLAEADAKKKGMEALQVERQDHLKALASGTSGSQGEA